MRALGDELDAAVSDQDAAALATSVPDWPAFADSHDALEALGQHFKLIILSNVDRASFAASKTRLGVEFTSILTAQDIGSYKPSPRNFTALIQEARRLGIGAGNSCTSRRACSTITSPQNRPAFRPCGSTADTTAPAGARRQYPRPTSAPMRNSPQWPLFAAAVQAE